MCVCVQVSVSVCVNIIVGARAREGFSPVVLSRRPERGGPFLHSPVSVPVSPVDISQVLPLFVVVVIVVLRSLHSPNIDDDATPKADFNGLPGRPHLAPGRSATPGLGQ